MRLKIYLFAPIVLVSLFAGPATGQEPGIDKLLDFESESPDLWFVVNDGVMGGRSSSALTATAEGYGVFEGDLSLENNGGFASVRTELPAGALVDALEVVLRVRGDGKRYELRLRPGSQFDGVAYGASFDTVEGEWILVRLPISDFQPTFRGYRPPGSGPLDPSRIGQLGIMLTDKQEGPFRLEVDWIGIQREDHKPRSPHSVDTP